MFNTISLSQAAGTPTAESGSSAATQATAGSLVYGSKNAVLRNRDSIVLSSEAQQLLIAVELFSLANTSQSSTTGSPATFDGASSTPFAQLDVSGAVAESLSTSIYNGNAISFAVVDGPQTADGILNISASNEATEGRLVTQVNVGDGNDTVNASTNSDVRISLGSGDDTANVSTTGSQAWASVNLGSGDTTANLIGSGIVFGGGGTEIVNVQYGSSGADAVGAGGSGTTTINGIGRNTLAFGGTGVTTINNIANVDLGSYDTGTSTINLPNAPYSHVTFFAGFGNTTINLSDPALGTSTETSSYLGEGSKNFIRYDKILPSGQADANGNYSGDGSLIDYQDVLPTQGQAGYGLAHTHLDFRGVTADQVTSSLSGSTLTLTVAGTGETTTVNNYQAGRVTFTFSSLDSDFFTASRQPPNLAAT